MLRNTLTLLIIAVVFFLINFTAYPSFTKRDDFYSNASIERTIRHIDKLSVAPGHVGTGTHTRSRRYIVDALQNMGLQVQMQKTTSLNSRGDRSAPIANILARIEGSDPEAKALLLMSHYDDANYHSPGAADAASGVATILEGVRAYLERKQPHRNDIIILITDGEELGLLGAKAFVRQHAWAQDIGLVLNFEARGTSGPAYMLMETVSGNQQLLKAFKETGAPFPVSNSLAYEIYKMLPNDTDVTELKKIPGVQGYNFAFIDDHFNYHTAQDDLSHLSINSIAHQTTYLTHTLDYFANHDLDALQSSVDQVFISIPHIGILDYPTSWNVWIVIGISILALIVLFIGIRKQYITWKTTFDSLISLVFVLLINVGVVFALLAAIDWLYPKYQDIRQGFPYNGYWYIYACISLSTIITLLFYSRKKATTEVHALIPALLWLLVGAYLSYAMPGATFLIFIGCAALLLLGLRFLSPKTAEFVDLVLLLAILIIITPLIFTIPTALGLQSVWISSALITLVIASMASVISRTQHYRWQYIWFLIPIWFLFKAEQISDFTHKRAAQSSLAYWIDADTNDAWWLSNDRVLTDWNRPYFQQQDNDENAFQNWKNTYYQWASRRSQAPAITPEKAQVTVLNDRRYRDQRIVSLEIRPASGTHHIRLLTPVKLEISRLDINRSVVSESAFTVNANRPIIRHYMGTDYRVIIDMTLPPDSEMSQLTLQSYIPGIENIEALNVSERPDNEMPMAFVNTDVMIVNQSMTLPNQQ
ncbi:M20/M25/M40 family metallo-hydrolase [Marinicella sp. W31]|uniref:M20/M25/M40 family metallo-hydrolase n=1 Tax=Marinicella sp. W31 TaxID=3023713 RepID=UPI00375796EA